MATKVEMIHSQLEKIQFPYHITSEKNEDAHILKQQWYEGKSADYRKHSDQKQTLISVKNSITTSATTSLKNIWKLCISYGKTAGRRMRS